MRGINQQTSNFSSNQEEIEVEEEKAKESFGVKEVISVSINLPVYEYGEFSGVLIPLDRSRTNDLRFDRLDDAMLYIKNHCYHHYGRFSQNLARSYIRECSVYNPLVNMYIVQDDTDSKEFKRSFRLINHYY